MVTAMMPATVTRRTRLFFPPARWLEESLRCGVQMRYGSAVSEP